jgi:hypothetical protein
VFTLAVAKFPARDLTAFENKVGAGIAAGFLVSTFKDARSSVQADARNKSGTNTKNILFICIKLRMIKTIISR